MNCKTKCTEIILQRRCEDFPNAIKEVRKLESPLREIGKNVLDESPKDAY